MKMINASALCGKDSLGRELPAVGAEPASSQRQVGLFYFMCHDSKDAMYPGAAFFEDVLDAYDKETLGSGSSPFYDHPYGIPFYWGKPLLGTYQTTDEWVMRKHVELFVAAGIDFLVIDATNLNSFVEPALLLMRILDEGQRDGLPVPKIAFYTNTDSGIRIREIYEGIYAKNLFPDTWYCVDGKPVIIGIAEQTDPELLAYFHFKNSQWPGMPVRENAFPWIDFGWPQTVYAAEDGTERIVSVSVAQNSDKTACFSQNFLYGSDGCHGRSYHNGDGHITADSYKYGYNFAEQWEGARRLSPDTVFVTGWNEWTAGVWTHDSKEHPVAIFDCLNAEYSRDIEPMQGGYGDGYYFQLIEQVRKFKGIRSDEKVSLPASFDNLTTAGVSRKSQTFDGEICDDSLRNIIVRTEVEKVGENYIFTAVTKTSIDPDDRIGDWMRLLVNTKVPEVFEFCFNMRTVDDSRTVAAIRKNEQWERIGLIGYQLSENRIRLTVPASMFGETQKLYIKWVDSRKHCHTGDDFYLYGSAAPIGRLFYRVDLAADNR